MNKVELRGHLKDDAVLTHLQSGDPVLTWTLAVNGTRWSKADNAHIVTTAWILCRMYADQVIDLINTDGGEPKRGDDVYVAGELTQIQKDPEKTERKTGVTVFSLTVIRRRSRT